ncbi:ATP-binding protein [Aromatoleum toluclasticum]|uniref:ATP-binding protein n=1 Tax=Aromatoleum toluclasticum TaxID=92003 RepID=UPI00036233C3|nr:ATP-binding protein [Aromatoleum toluclasticum]
MNNESKKVCVGEIHSSRSGFASLARLSSALQGYFLDTVEVDFSACTWFDANMSAPLGVVLAHAVDNLNELKLCGINPRVETILAKNRFLVGFGFPERNDTHGTTIPYRRFSADDDRYFAAYLNQHLRGKGLPTMSVALSERFRNSVLEIFVNAAMHSDSKLGIFACGQYFPQQHRLDFCVADAGIGIRRKIHTELGLKMNSDKAIEWALQEGNTTKTGSVPGGLGLKLIREFIAMNKGRIQIVSDRGYWELRPEGETLTRIDTAFPGTVINIEINTADTGSYRLHAESGH